VMGGFLPSERCAVEVVVSLVQRMVRGINSVQFSRSKARNFVCIVWLVNLLELQGFKEGVSKGVHFLTVLASREFHILKVEPVFSLSDKVEVSRQNRVIFVMEHGFLPNFAVCRASVFFAARLSRMSRRLPSVGW